MECSDSADWSVFSDSHPHEGTGFITSATQFCKDLVVRSTTELSLNNHNPWRSKGLVSERKAAFITGDMDILKDKAE